LLIALLADVHSNLEALDACLKHAAESGAGRYAFLGDFVGYGADPAEVVATISRRVAEGAVAVKGNHDDAIEKRAGYMNESTKESIEWTRAALPAVHKAFLAALPLIVHEGPMCFVHASAQTPTRWDYVDTPAAARRSADAAQSTYTFSGHVHDQALYFEGSQGKWSAFAPIPGSPVPIRAHRRWLAIAGSVGQPRDGKPAAAYALFDTDREEITFHRIAYDHLAAARKIRKAGLPLAHAYRVERGI
jgi:diadenosine tetraphosphatase ApaH/serine/threonine PP2A family protein phosphatase